MTRKYPPSPEMEAIEKLMNIRDELRARIAELEEALRFYATRSNYFAANSALSQSLIDDDEGSVARRALEVKDV